MHEYYRIFRPKLFLTVSFLLGLVWFSLFPLSAQNFRPYVRNAFAEKIYLQLDSKVYSSARIVWFKAIVTNAFDHVPSA